MERFGLSRHDLMCMSWSQVIMMFDAVYEEGQDDAPKNKGGDVIATPAMYDAWA